MKILNVDDDETIRMAVRQILTGAGYEVLTACDGQEGLKLLHDNPDCQLVVSDWEMPEMSGVELCRAIRTYAVDRYVYIILLTSRNKVEDTVEGISAGADDFITKPFNPEELKVRIRAGERIIGLETRELAIFAMAQMVESRDHETGAHLERVRSYSRVLAEHLRAINAFPNEIDPEFCHLIYLTSPLHDIGKISISDSILCKKGKLTEEEFDTIKTHAVKGAETLQAALDHHPRAEFLRMARDIARSHHERYDGGGYPDGLKGDAIPLAARIVTLADVYDALTSKRVYKDAFSHKKSRGMITEESSKQFDPNVVDAFVANEAEFENIRRQFNA